MIRSGIWRDNAACLGMPTDQFFPEASSNLHVVELRKLCKACPVAAACLEEGLAVDVETGGRHGIWGGYSPKQRAKLALRRKQEPAA